MKTKNPIKSGKYEQDDFNPRTVGQHFRLVLTYPFRLISISLMARCLKRVGTTSLDYRYLAGLGTTQMNFWAGNLFRRTEHLKFLRHCSQFENVLHQNM